MDQCRLSVVADLPPEDPDRRWRIDDLAQRTGLTVRNIRAYQSRGLLPGPDVHGRTGFYGPEHAERITLIRELQGQGFNLEAIRRLIDAAPAESTQAFSFLRAVNDSFAAERPQRVTPEELAEQWGPDGAAAFKRTIELGLLRETGDGGYEYPSPQLARGALELGRMGVPLDRLLDLVARISELLDGVTAEYVDVFLAYSWPASEASGDSDARWNEARESLERLAPLARESLNALFSAAMADATERVLSDLLAGRLPRQT